MASFLILVTGTTPPAPVPDDGVTGFLLGLGILSLGIVARFLKTRKR
jgi:hypothetical protein